jgi:hypothetical protein
MESEELSPATSWLFGCLKDMTIRSVDSETEAESMATKARLKGGHFITPDGPSATSSASFIPLQFNIFLSGTITS